MTLKEYGLVLNVLEGWLDYFPSKFKLSSDKKMAWLQQSHLIESLEEKIGEQSKSGKVKNAR